MEDSASLVQGEARLKERYPMLRYFTARPFGVEIELFGLKYSISAGDREVIPPYKIMNRSAAGVLLPRVFEQRGFILDGDSAAEPLYTAWSLMTDDSIKGAGGGELVSPILSGVQGLIQVYQVIQLLREFPELQVNETCGFHVHHGVDPETFGNRELFQLMRIVAIFENYIYHLLPEDRRHADTCRPLEIDLYNWDFRKDRDTRDIPPPRRRHWCPRKHAGRLWHWAAAETAECTHRRRLPHNRQPRPGCRHHPSNRGYHPNPGTF